MIVRRTSILLILALALFTTAASAASSGVVISQIYGGAGCTSPGCSTYKNDYIELFNRGTTAVSLNGWSVQYASSAGTSWQVTALPNVLVQPGKYYLVQQAFNTNGSNVLPVTPDVTGTINMSATTGKVALVSSATAITSGTSCPSGATIIDFVGYGTANCFEGAVAPAPSTTNAIFRANGGCTETDNNSTDFSAAAASPRNNATTASPCPVANNPPTINAPAEPITVAQDAPPFTVGLTGNDDNGVYNWSASTGNGISAVSVTGGQGSANVTFTVTLQAAFSGTASFTASLSDNVNATVTRTVNIQVDAPNTTADHLVISQIYGGGGNSGATYRNDYVELHNPTGAPINTNGWSIQYAAASATSSFNQVQALAGVINPGEYYLVQLASGGAVGAFLPTPNITGDINMSGTTGKVALVSNTTSLGLSCTGATVVDLVGYGTSASCSEANADAPAPSNTTAIFRKNGGATDTNNNANDFVTGAPNPRVTAAIPELAPGVQSTEPSFNGTNAPRDASITVNFTEAVNVTGAWYNINCASTGLHNSATTASTINAKTHVITPNVNFQPGEQCTVTIIKELVNDQDTDDTATTDTMTANYVWSFTVAVSTATLPPAAVHLAMGNPSGAVTDAINAPNNYLMVKPELALSYSRDRGIPNWVSWHLSDDWTGSAPRTDTFRPDPAVPADWYRVQAFDYSGSGFDRGHLAPSADRNEDLPVNHASFLMTNMMPQAPGNNQGPWEDLESHLRSLLPATATPPRPQQEIYVVSGGAGVGGSGTNGFAISVAGGRVTVPAQTWKCALVLEKLTGDDVARVGAGTQTICVIMPNSQTINSDWRTYLVTVDQVESLTGYNLFSNVSDAVENAIEAGIEGANPPGTAGGSVTLAEDTPTAISLDAAGTGTLSYIIVSGPSFGTLSGSDANQTYTPAPNYYGTDSFTFKVSDGVRESNVSTVSITITPVNDLPVVNISTPTSSPEGTAINATSTASDVESSTLSYAWTVSTAGSVVASGSDASISYTPQDNGTYDFSLTVTDGDGGSSTATSSVNVTNANPSIAGAVSGPSAPLLVGSSATLGVAYTDAGAADTHTAVATWDDGTSTTVACSAGSCTASHTYTAAGVYGVSITVVDDDGGSSSAARFEYVIIYDPDAGFVNGGGWISSAAGAYRPDPTASGRATFGFNYRYLPGATSVTGNLQMKFGAANLDFASTAQDWLVVAETRSQISGTGTVNGVAGYAFLLTAADGDVSGGDGIDRYRLRISHVASGAVVYDNNVSGAPNDIDLAAPQAIGGGNIAIAGSKK